MKSIAIPHAGSVVPNRVSVGMGKPVLPPLVKRYFPQRVDTVSTLYLTLPQVGTTWREDEAGCAGIDFAPASRARHAAPIRPWDAGDPRQAQGRTMHKAAMTGNDGAGSKHGLRPLVWGGAACLLLLPALVMRLYPQAGVDWTALDFAVMGVLLAAVCGLYEFAAWLGGSLAYRAGFGVAVLAGFLTIWVNLAVGMLGSEGNVANLMFVGVLGIAGLGSLLARFRAAGMANAMFAAALAQLAAVGIAMAVGGFGERELALTAGFALPWMLAGALFRYAAR